MIELAREPVSGDALRPQPDPTLALEVLLEHPDIVVVNKPAGMPSQPLRAGELGTVANAVVARWPECAAIGDDPRDGGLVHRLDIGTSGVLVAARTDARTATLREAFGKGEVAQGLPRDHRRRAGLARVSTRRSPSAATTSPSITTTGSPRTP